MNIYFIEQKITPFANQYMVFDERDGAKGSLAAYVHQKRLAIKENILFYGDETKQDLILQVKARQILEAAATYDVLDTDNKLLGSLKKQFTTSLLRSTWSLLPAGSDKPLVMVRERSVAKAIVRRIWGLLPYIGDLPFLLKYHFDFVDTATGEVIGTYNKTTLLRDRYQLSTQNKLNDMLDWRVLVAIGVCLDALQSR